MPCFWAVGLAQLQGRLSSPLSGGDSAALAVKQREMLILPRLAGVMGFERKIKMSVTNRISAKTVYDTLLHANLKDLEKQIDKKSAAQDLWVSIYNIANQVQQDEEITKGTY